MKRTGGFGRGLASGFAKMLLRSGGLGAGLAARLLAKDPSPEAQGWRYYAEAILAWRRGDHFGALDLMRQAARALPEDPQIAVSLALAFANVGEWDVAVDAGERALKFYAAAGDEPQLWQMLAWGYLITGRYRSVIELMQRMQDAGVSLAPIELPLLLARAMVWQQEPPVAQLRVLLKRMRSQLPAYLRFVEHLAQTGHDRVAHLMLAALPAAVVVHAMDVLASRASSQGRSDLVLWAANALDRLEVGPELARAIAALAAVMAGDAQAARQYAAQAAQLGPDHPLVHEKLALVYSLLDDERMALDAATRAVMRGSADAFSAGLVAAGLADKGAWTEARKIFATQKSADALGALVGRLAQARIFAHMRQPQDAARLLELAAATAGDVPPWAQAPAMARFVRRQLAALDQVIEPDLAAEPRARLARWADQILGENSVASDRPADPSPDPV